MASLNKVLLIGNLTRDPELRYTPNGTAICQFALAVNRRFKGANGAEKTDTCYIDILVWGAQGETAERYLKKGSPVFIEGRLQMDQWDDKDTGQRRTKLQVIADNYQFLSGRERNEDGTYENVSQNTNSERPRSNNYPSQNRSYTPNRPQPQPAEDVFAPEAEDNIPF